MPPQPKDALFLSPGLHGILVGPEFLTPSTSASLVLGMKECALLPALKYTF